MSNLLSVYHYPPTGSGCVNIFDLACAENCKQGKASKASKVLQGFGGIVTSTIPLYGWTRYKVAGLHATDYEQVASELRQALGASSVEIDGDCYPCSVDVYD
jgi:hypothetical protein